MEVTLDVSAVPARPAGAGRYIIDLAREVGNRLRADLGLVCTTGDAARWQAIAPAARTYPVLPARRAARLAAEQVVPLIRPHRPRGTLWHGPHYSLPLAYRRGPRVVTIHDLSFLSHPEWHEPAKVAYFKRMIPAAARRADHVLCVSERTRTELLSLIPLDPERVSVTPLGLDERLLDAAPATPAGIADGRPYVLALGTAEPRKNLVRLIAAFDRIAPEFPDLVLALAGQTGWRNGPIAEAIACSDHRHRIVELGYVPDEELPALLAGAQALCYPSLYEGFGLPVLEALASGAVVVTSAGTVMQDNAAEAAMYVDPLDEGSIAEGLRTALNLDAGPRSARIEAGRARARAFTWTRTADLTIEGYEQATAHWARRG